MTEKERKKRAILIIEGIIQEWKEFGAGYGILEKYEGAMSVIRHLEILSAAEEEAFDKELDAEKEAQ